MIGFFDSGLGGLHTMKYFQKLYPQYKYEFLGDFSNAPYGEKEPDWIKNQTFKNLKILFNKGCKIVILACNTASAFAIREWQKIYPNKKVLSITIPGIEYCLNKGYTNISIIATYNTVKSGIYPELFERLSFIYQKNIKKRVFNIQQIVSTDLVPLIEQGNVSPKKIGPIVRNYCKQISSKSECLILGCTHFPILQSEWERNLDIDIVDPGMQSAIIFGQYLSRHPEIKNKLSINNL